MQIWLDWCNTSYSTFNHQLSSKVSKWSHLIFNVTIFHQTMIMLLDRLAVSTGTDMYAFISHRVVKNIDNTYQPILRRFSMMIPSASSIFLRLLFNQPLVTKMSHDKRCLQFFWQLKIKSTSCWQWQWCHLWHQFYQMSGNKRRKRKRKWVKAFIWIKLVNKADWWYRFSFVWCTVVPLSESWSNGACFRSRFGKTGWLSSEPMFRKYDYRYCLWFKILKLFFF